MAALRLSSHGGKQSEPQMPMQSKPKFKPELKSFICLIELNQQQNLDLTKSNNNLTEQLKEQQQRYVEQTELLRSVQAKLLKSEDDKVKLVQENGDLKVELAQKKCEDLPCPFRLPPNAYTPPAEGVDKESYIKKTRTAKKAKK